MNVFDCATENIKQGGRRRGANMGVLRADHPDILEFINAKLDGRTLQNFNLSVGVTESFLQCLREDKRFELKHPCTGRTVDALIRPKRSPDILSPFFQSGWSWKAFAWWTG